VATQGSAQPLRLVVTNKVRGDIKAHVERMWAGPAPVPPPTNATPPGIELVPG